MRPMALPTLRMLRRHSGLAAWWGAAKPLLACGAVPGSASCGESGAGCLPQRPEATGGGEEPPAAASIAGPAWAAPPASPRLPQASLPAPSPSAGCWPAWRRTLGDSLPKAACIHVPLMGLAARAALLDPADGTTNDSQGLTIPGDPELPGAAARAAGPAPAASGATHQAVSGPWPSGSCCRAKDAPAKSPPLPAALLLRSCVARPCPCPCQPVAVLRLAPASSAHASSRPLSARTSADVRAAAPSLLTLLPQEPGVAVRAASAIHACMTGGEPWGRHPRELGRRRTHAQRGHGLWNGCGFLPVTPGGTCPCCSRKQLNAVPLVSPTQAPEARTQTRMHTSPACCRLNLLHAVVLAHATA